MKNKKAFTLIEMIGIITILALILVIALPSMTKTLKRNEQKKYDNYINNLKMVSESYLVDQLQRTLLTFNDDVTYFTLGDLIDAGYVKDTIVNPSNDKKISRDTRIKVVRDIDNTYSFEIQEYYNNTSDYNKENLIIHYDAVKYSGGNKFINNANEVNYDFKTNAIWTENGMLFEQKDISTVDLNKTYSTDSLTVSFNVNSLEDLGTCGSCYTWPLFLYNYDSSANSSTIASRFGFRKDVFLFYESGNSTVLTATSLEKNKNYTLTFVQEGLTTRRIYINGKLLSESSSKTGLSLSTITYNRIWISPKLYNLKINNMLIYNRALSSGEIENLYNLDKVRFGE